MSTTKLAALFLLALVLPAGRNAVAQSAPATFTNPLKLAGPDPWVIARDGYFYYMNTTGSNLTIWKTARITDLAHAEKKVVWTPPATGMYSKELWAPELHFFQGKWYIYFSADDGKNANHRVYVLENPSPDPTLGDWTFKGKLADDTDKWAIDATVFEHAGKLYAAWSGEDRPGVQAIYMAQLKNPWTIMGTHIRLSVPEYPWEKVGDLARPDRVVPIPHVDVNEGPEFLEHGDKIFLIYSASGCWTNSYALGMLTASASANLMQTSSWTKSPVAVFSANPAASAYGPGHNTFFKSPDGTQDWILYHANPKPGQGCGNFRSPRAQPFTWKPDGTPDFGQPLPIDTPIPVPSGQK